MTSNSLYRVLCSVLLLAWPIFVNADEWRAFRLDGGMTLRLQSIDRMGAYVQQGLESIPGIGKQEVLMSRRFGILGGDRRIEYGLIVAADKTGSSEVIIDGEVQVGGKAWWYQARARKDNWQESVLLVIEALSRLPSESAVGRAVMMPKDLFANAARGMASRTSIPVNVPASIQSLDEEGMDGCTDAKFSRDSFSIALYGRLAGNGQAAPPCVQNDAARLAEVRGDVKPMPDLSGRPSAQAVVLRSGARGWFLPVSCGASCAPATLYWQTPQASYSIQMKFGSTVPASRQQQELLDAANSVQVVPAVTAQGTGCRYSSKADKGSMVFADRCGEAGGSKGLSLLPEVREDLYHDENGLACVVLSRDEAFLVHRNGRSARGPVIDTNCPWFEEGLSIGTIDDRQVYIDKGLNVALDPGFESLSHFQGGYAQVCNGPFNHEQVGERARTTGGKCGMIDRSGKLVMDLVHPMEQYAAFVDFRNAHNGCPAPPIEERRSALCHAQRHAFSDNWTILSIEPVEDRWEVTYSFLDPVRNRERTYVMHLGREKAYVQRHEEKGLRR